MAFEGYLDRCTSTEVSGWVFDNSRPNEPLGVEVLLGEQVVGEMRAEVLRADLAAVGKGDGRHGFSFKLEGGKTGELRVRVVGKRWFIPMSGGAKKFLNLPMRFDDELLHTVEYGLPVAMAQEGFSPVPEVTQRDEEIARRLMAAYAKTMSDHPDAKGRKGDVWLELEAGFHQEILSLLKADDAKGLMKYLRDAHAKGITHGITQGEHTTHALRGSADARRLVMLTVLDHLTSLAEYLGVLDVESPEQHGQWGENFHSEPEELIERISKAIGVEVVVPQVVGSAFGLKTRGGILTNRDVLALYAALRIQKLGGKDVCEIGGGLGGVAFYANRLGVEKYTIIDLPLVSLLQGYFLLSALPEGSVGLYGEAGGGVRLLPTYVFGEASKSCDTLFNMDSIPEMHRDYALGYLRAARENGTSRFLSINQEARAMQDATHRQTAVREIVAEVGGYQMEYRFRHWIKAGYVEELFEHISA